LKENRRRGTTSTDLSTIEGIDIQKDMTAPIFVYLKLTNFYQNHKDMISSKSLGQLKRKITPKDS
jgi:LEM3 (ligand-effect modulator 3) family / CDC50 family